MPLTLAPRPSDGNSVLTVAGAKLNGTPGMIYMESAKADTQGSGLDHRHLEAGTNPVPGPGGGAEPHLARRAPPARPR